MAIGKYTSKETIGPFDNTRSVVSPTMATTPNASESSKLYKTTLSILLISMFVTGLTIGAGIHVSYISEIYFAYTTTTSVTMVKDMSPELPAITICMYLKNTFNKTKFFEKFGRHKNRTEPIPSELTISEINELGINMDDTITAFRSQFLGHEEFEWAQEDWRSTSTSIHIHRDLKCITMFRSKRPALANALPFGTLLLLKLKYFFQYFGDHENYETLYRIYVHAPTANIGEVLYATSFEIKAGHTVILKLRRINSVLLPAPYDTDCLDYSDYRNNNFQTRADCVDKCILDKSEFNLKKWPREIGINLTDNVNYNWSDLYVQSEPNLCVGDDNNCVLKECQANKCKQVDCIQNYIEPSLVVDKVDPVHNGTNTSDLFIWLPTEPDLRIVHNPKMAFVEYMSYLGSVVSLWFGMSALAIVRYFKKLFYKKKNKIFCQKELESSNA